MPDTITLIGILAAVLTTGSFAPQVFRTWRMKEAKDISLWMFLIMGTGIFLWMVYGILLRDVPLILANSISLVFILIILYFKVKYR